jgi:2-dehydro-3-deoxyphosphogluconate aldolase/(4S)-4-hydroxy-2-oxoglutarate aldolase
MLNAKRAGADLVKIFPADTVGGTYFVRQLLGPFPDMRLMVSGGVNAANVAEYASLGVTGICLGSSMLREELMKNGRAGLASLARSYVDSIESVAAAQKSERTK